MSFSYLKKLPTPAEIREQYPLSERGKEIKRRKDQALRDIFTGKSDKFLVVIGPCSADNEDAVCDYISRLSRVSEKVKDRIEIVPRIYTYKPRTNGDGYKGIAFQPNPEERPDLVAGLIAIRRLQMRSIEEFGLPQQMKCCILKTGVMWKICSLMWLSEPVPLRISTTARQPVVLMCLQE